MCGIAGFFIQELKSKPRQSHQTAINMITTLQHRGPNGINAKTLWQQQLALAHSRLAINDLSQNAEQPMQSASGNLTLVFNGEIYNFKPLRHELEQLGFIFKSHSDTEVLLAAMEQWGIEEALKRAIGMFALAVFDAKNQTLFLARDRIGKKPLYWSWQKNNFFFASELKALVANKFFDAKLNSDIIASYLRFSYVPTPYSIYEGVYKLAPGHILKFQPGKKPSLSCYWSLLQIAASANPILSSEAEVIEEFSNLLHDAVSKRLIADVKVGAFLSGGIDSSLTTAIAARKCQHKMQTFSIGFDDKDFNEAIYAKQIAEHLGTEHTEFYLTAKDALNIIPKLGEIYDEPFADSSQIPTLFVSQLAAKDVTVAISGDGGDELFAGYTRYLFCDEIWKYLKSIPYPLRKILSKTISSTPEQFWSVLRKLAPQKYANKINQYYAKKIARTLKAHSHREIYQALISHWPHPAAAVISQQEQMLYYLNPDFAANTANNILQMQLIDLHSYLPDDILVKVDRASMHYSLEARCPLLDHRIIEFALRLPLNFKIRNQQSKWLLRKTLHQHVPAELFNRPKQGFGIPLAKWLRTDLKEYMLDMLAEDKIKSQGLLNHNVINEKITAFFNGDDSLTHQLWSVVMLQSWQQRWLETNITAAKNSVVV